MAEIRHHRRSLRLAEYDYSQAGAYFVTLCTQERERILGEVMGDDVELSAYGQIVSATWGNLPRRFEGLDLDEFVVMPNHVHGIVVITGNADVGFADGGAFAYR